jgi:hypothetical protein
MNETQIILGSDIGGMTCSIYKGLREHTRLHTFVKATITSSKIFQVLFPPHVLSMLLISIKIVFILTKDLVAHQSEQNRAREGIFQMVSILLGYAIYKATRESWVIEK